MKMFKSPFLWAVAISLAIAALTVVPYKAHAGTITITVVQGAQPDATKTFTLPDAQITRLVAAYQSLANVAVNGTATRAQVLNYVLTQVWLQSTVDFVKGVETAAAKAAVPDAVPINPQ